MHGQAEQHKDRGPSPLVESKFFAPPAELEGCFTTFYRMNLRMPDGHTVSDFMAPEWASIRFFSGDSPKASIGNQTIANSNATGTGPNSLAAHFEIGATRMWGIGFLPVGWARFFESEAQEVADCLFDLNDHAEFARFRPLADVLCDDSVDENEQARAIAEFMRKLMRRHPEEERILRIHRVLLDENLTKVSDFAAEAGIGVRTLERLCRRFFGFSPKLLLRRQRFVRSLAAFMLKGGGKWTDAMDTHYHDQAQFSREFSNFMGVTPSEYASRDHPFMRSFVAARAASLGSPAQTLDAPGG